MAAVNIKELFEDMQKCFECAVCMDRFKDPRALDCQHQFCLQCLQSLVSATQPDATDVDRVKCPTCRKMTNLGARKSLSDLPRPTLVNTLQDLMEKVVGTDVKNLDITMCDICKVLDQTATSYCLQCNKHLCEPCLRKHEGFKPLRSHLTIPLLEELQCQTHKEVFQVYCETCEQNLCPLCLIKEHPQNHTTLEYHSELMYTVDTKYKRNKPVYHKLTSLLKGKVKEMEEAYERAELEICDWYSGCKKLLRERTDALLRDLLKSRMQQADVLHMDPRKRKSDEIKMILPNLGDAFDVQISEMKKLLSDIQLRYAVERISLLADEGYYPLDWTDETNILDEEGIENLRKVFTVKVNKAITDIKFDSEMERIFLKTKSLESPIRVYTYSGEQIGKWGQDIKGINLEGGICQDTKRNVFLVTCSDSITIVNDLGYVQDKIRVPVMKKKHCGVAYSPREDLYAVTDIGTHCLQIIDPRSKTVVSKCGSQGEGNFHFDGPYYVKFNEMFAQTVVTVSDVFNHCVKVFDLSCTHLRTYGGFGYTPGKLDHPRGLAVDKEGRVLVCDQFNHRVVRHWRGEEKPESECVISATQLGNECPWAIDYSAKFDLLAISHGTGEFSVYSDYSTKSVLYV